MNKTEKDQSEKKDKTESEFQIFYENGKLQNCFTQVEEIGEGGFGKVYKAMHRLEEHVYAVKKIEMRVKKGDDPRKLPVFREVATMVNMHHNRIVRYITSWVEQEE